MKVVFNYQSIFDYMTENMISALRHELENQKNYPQEIIDYGRNCLRDYSQWKEWGDNYHLQSNL